MTRKTFSLATIRSNYGCDEGSEYSQHIVQWMTANGHPGYAESIRNAQDAYMETICDAGRYWMHCEFTRERLDKINAEIAETFQAACDRYEDWASD